MGKRKKKSTGKGRFLKILLILLILVLAAEVVGLVAVNRLYIRVGDQLINRDSTELDLRGKQLSVEEYLELAAQLPDCRILWDIPVDGGSYSSDVVSLALSEVNEEILTALGYFENLQTIDARAIVSAAELEELEQAMPDCTIRWAVHLAGETYDPAETVLDLTDTGVTAQELTDNLDRFDALERVILVGTGLTREEREALAEAFPEICFMWDVQVQGKTWLNTDTCLSFAGSKVDVAELIAAAGEFNSVQQIDLTGCGLTMAELAAVREAYGGAFVLAEITLYGQTFTTDATYLDFSNTKMESTDQIAAMAALMPYLEKVDMCDCGISNEDMDDLNRQFENTLFVWKVHFSVYTLRTDATYFCASDLPSNGYIGMKLTDAQLEPLKYCTELIALDLGHMYYTDLSFLYNMPKLQYLILVEARFRDITPIGSLKDLVYLEIFVNTFEDLSPLLSCTSLRHLNIGYTSGYDPKVLKEMTWLERLWYPGHGQNSAVIDEIIAALPETDCYMPPWDSDGSTGNGWREADIYYEMRDMFHMSYMPGGTGTDALKGS